MRSMSTHSPLGSCPLKLAGVEHCGLCGLAHYGFSRICPHINSETQVREMIQAVKSSSEAGHLKAETMKYLTGLKGTLVQKKKKRGREESCSGEWKRESECAAESTTTDSGAATGAQWHALPHALNVERDIQESK
ncbi:unnamed protein product [Aureobasidium pullulans]|nr:unnamed protein product [Aureobasidium pullulans]